MAKAKQAKSEFSELAGEVASQLLINRRKLLEQAEAIIRGAVEAGRELNYSEIDFLSGEVNFDQRKIKDEMRRLTDVVRTQAIVGDSATRAKHKQNAEAAQADLVQRVPELDEQIAQLQAEKARLEKTAADFVRREEQIAVGLERLKTLAPPLSIARYNAKRSNLDSLLMRQILDTGTELQHYQVLLAKDTNNQQDLQDLWLHCREFMTQVNTNRQLSYAVKPAEWAAECQRMREMIPQLEQDIAAMQEQYDSELADIESELQIYWN